MSYITFNGVSSSDFGLYVGGKNSFNAPQKNTTMVSIPGRNGDLIIHDETFNNISVQYNIVGMSDFKNKTNDIKEWLLSPRGYARLYDSFNPDYYRLAIVQSGIQFFTYKLNTVGKAVLTFYCKPQRFLTVGDTPYTLGNSGTIVNPTEFYSKPLIHVTGYGVFMINGTQITVANTYADTYIDCDLMDCYSGVNNANSAVSFSTNDFPELKPGSNTYSVTTNHFTKIEITPRWWTV